MTRLKQKVIDAQSWTAMFRAFSSYQQPSAYLTKSIPQSDKPLGKTEPTLAAYTAAVAF